MTEKRTIIPSRRRPLSRRRASFFEINFPSSNPSVPTAIGACESIYHRIQAHRSQTFFPCNHFLFRSFSKVIRGIKYGRIFSAKKSIMYRIRHIGSTYRAKCNFRFACFTPSRAVACIFIHYGIYKCSIAYFVCGYFSCSCSPPSRIFADVAIHHKI